MRVCGLPLAFSPPGATYTILFELPRDSNKIASSLENSYMEMLALCVLVQLFFAFGVAGLLWPEKFMSLFGVLMFPWQANDRIIRANGMLAIAAYFVIIATLFVRML
jgi:hypothetical protein